jgi:hypothetical protein
MTGNGPPPSTVNATDRWTPRQRTTLSLAAVLIVVLLGGSALGVTALQPAPTERPLDLDPAAELDRRWGTYVSEREWGTPREALGDDGWGLSWRGAIDTDYRYSDDGIAAIADLDAEFRVGWAFWTSGQEHVTERFYGARNGVAESGEAILDDRVQLESSPTHAYARMAYRYPRLPADSQARARAPFEIDLESARADSTRSVMAATVTNVGAMERTIDVVLKAWQAPLAEIAPIDGGLVLRGEDNVVVVVGPSPTAWQTRAAKEAIDVALRSGGLSNTDEGHIGALSYRLRLAPGATRSLRFAVVEAPTEREDEAIEEARRTLGQAAAIVAARRTEARGTFRADVTRHEELYEQALMTLLWNESFYRWDGASGVSPEWAGRVDARDVLIVPDKWEYPWLSSWQSAFHALTASLIDEQLAEDQLLFVLSERWMQPHGHIPCGEWVMADECPPLFAWAAWRIYQAGRDRAFLAEVYPALQLSYDHWWQSHAVADGLFGGGSMGMDNLPRAPGAAQSDASAWMAFFARDMARIASELHDGPASDRYWQDRGRIQDAINERLWDEASGFYYDRAADGSLVPHKSYSGLVPLIAGVVPPERIPQVLSALRDEAQLLSPAGIRSLSAASPLYEPGTGSEGVNANWRGPMWVPMNYLLVRALEEIDPSFAAEIRSRVVTTVENDWRQTGRLHEFFDGDTGAGLGADFFSPTALVANMIAEAWPAPISEE